LTPPLAEKKEKALSHGRGMGRVTGRGDSKRNVSLRNEADFVSGNAEVNAL